MASPVKTPSTSEQMQQLNNARKMAFESPAYFKQIVQGIFPLTAASSPVDLRRWAAEFIAEALACPALRTQEKDDLTISVIDAGALGSLVEAPDQDPLVLKAGIMAAASAYPVVVRWIISNTYHPQSWLAMSAIKSKILSIWEGAPTPVKLCCIKFVQRVILAQTASNGAEPKHSGLDVNLNMITPNQNLLDPRSLEAEAIGLLDRMLGGLQDNGSDVLIVDATLNTLAILARTRPATSNRIINAALNFNPLKLANSPMTPKNKVLIKSMTKTTLSFLGNILRRDPDNPLAPRISQQIQRLMRSRDEIFNEANRKRALPEQAAAGHGDVKRQKTEAAAPQPPLRIQPLAPGPHTLAEVFSLTNNTGLQGFDVTVVPAPLTARINIRTLASLDQGQLDLAINGVRDRLIALYAAAPAVPPVPVPVVGTATAQQAPANSGTAVLGLVDDDDDYEPDLYTAAEDTEQILNKLDNAPPEAPPEQNSEPLALGPFRLPPPPVLNPDTVAKVSQITAMRIFGPLSGLEDPLVRKPKAGLNRLAANSHDRDSWLTLITRLATRSTMGLEDDIKTEADATALGHPQMSLGNLIREMLFNYVLEDWRRRIEVAVAWCCEEWYNDQLAKREGLGAPLNYERCALRLMDGFLSYITAQDKVLTRFLSEIPHLSRELLGRLKGLCSDPTTVQLAMTSLLYLMMFKPPARELALDTVYEIWLEYEDARPLAEKYLRKWRPKLLEAHAAADGVSSGNGSQTMTA
ncbi:hypothetical protein QBC32DRAFT_210791 [Pseudoneurospora amorphoporcata]|uniref:Symplekin/Pta1 N-terminal domain-containing protein n=1 Tax=Pseudoneurospora amorphoporcata TaxID=241081 RepID=A0AAN6NW58_9PEZI|nr:hypothetical protein QBC32DRAFT_210791 [Pseudoneurospora amorphoporcata]